MSSSTGEVKILHRVLRYISGLAAASFFTEVRVIGGENVPKTGPIIVTATHHNMMLDPVILSSAFPYQRILNYWSKASLFVNPVGAYILYSSGNIPVNRKSKDRQSLFKGTFDALAKGYAVALFPEGTSYTEPRIMQVKDGAAWAALEYTKWRRESGAKTFPDDVTVVPAAIVYTNKSKYRSSVIMEFGRPIKMDEYKDQFMSSGEGDAKAAVKRLTRAIESELIEATINAPDWDTLYAARMARDLMWEGDRALNLDEFVIVSQTLVDLFSTSDATPNFHSVRRTLLEYYSLLQSTHLTNSVLSALPLPRTLDPNTPTPLPSRLFTLLLLVRDSLTAIIQLPFFVWPLIVHMPVYIMGRLGARLVEDEEETQAQNKVAFGLLSLLLIYPLSFFFLWAMFLYTRTGAFWAFGIICLFHYYHNRLINAYYETAKRCIAAWRVLVGVWAPKRWEFSVAALSEYTTPTVPKENEWIDRPKTPVARRSPSPSPATSSSSSPIPNIPAALPREPDLTLATQPQEPPVQTKPKRRPPARRIMRHVLRARVEAVKALASFFDYLEEEPSAKVYASPHLARRFGGFDEPLVRAGGGIKIEGEGEDGGGEDGEETFGWRTAGEVISFLKQRGAKIPKLGKSVEGEWAALSSDENGYSSG